MKTLPECILSINILYYWLLDCNTGRFSELY